jgi:hypothetical protein
MMANASIVSLGRPVSQVHGAAADGFTRPPPFAHLKMSGADARQLSASMRASTLLSHEVLQRRTVQHSLISIALARSRFSFVFSSSSLSAAWPRHVHSAEPRLPFVHAGIADAVLAA